MIRPRRIPETINHFVEILIKALSFQLPDPETRTSQTHPEAGLE